MKTFFLSFFFSFLLSFFLPFFLSFFLLSFHLLSLFIHSLTSRAAVLVLHFYILPENRITNHDSISWYTGTVYWEADGRTDFHSLLTTHGNAFMAMWVPQLDDTPEDVPEAPYKLFTSWRRADATFSNSSHDGTETIRQFALASETINQRHITH